MREKTKKEKIVLYFTSVILSLIFYLAKIIFHLCFKSRSNARGITYYYQFIGKTETAGRFYHRSLISVVCVFRMER